MSDLERTSRNMDAIIQLQKAVAGLLERERERWEDIAELRDELHDLAGRVDHVHREALRALTDAMKGRDHAEATPGTHRE